MPDFVDERIRDIETEIILARLELNDIEGSIEEAKGLRPVDPSLPLKMLEREAKIREINGLKDRLKMWKVIKELLKKLPKKGTGGGTPKQSGGVRTVAQTPGVSQPAADYSTPKPGRGDVDVQHEKPDKPTKPEGTVTVEAVGRPDPNALGGFQLSGVSFLDDAALRVLAVQFGLIAERSGPIQALYPDDGGGGWATGDVELDLDMLDPVAPYAGGEHYDPKTPRRPLSGAAPDLSGRGVEALYPDNGDDRGNEADNATRSLVNSLIGDRPLAPREPGDPHAVGFGGTIVAIGGLAGSGSI